MSSNARPSALPAPSPAVLASLRAPAGLVHLRPGGEQVLTTFEERRALQRLGSLRRFATASAAQAPAALRGGLPRSQWLALSESERLDRIGEHLATEAVRARPDIPPRLVVPSPLPMPAADDKPDRGLGTRRSITDPGSAVVQCAGGCGHWLPARPGRAVLQSCSAPRSMPDC